MNYKALLEEGEPVYQDHVRFKHYKNAQLSERYFANYLSYQAMPSLVELKADLAYLAQEQTAYEEDYAFLFFTENEDLPADVRTYLESEGFDASRHLIFTNQVERLGLQARDLASIEIVHLAPTHLEAYLQKKYQDHLVYGQAYADQMLAENRDQLLQSACDIYLAMNGQQIVGEVTAWYAGEYVEIDDFYVDENWRGRGIGSALQLAAIGEHHKVILIAEEENRDMYEHQGYQQVAWYWTYLKSRAWSRSQ